MWMIEEWHWLNWADAEWTVDDKPERFQTKATAEAAIDTFIDYQHTEVDAGNMTDYYERDKYRAVHEYKATPEQRR